jgi:phage protein D
MSLLPDSLNNARIPTGTVRQPRCKVTVNGTLLTGVMEVEVTNASHFTADTFRVVAATSTLPASLNPAYWGLSVGDVVQISVGFADATGNIGSATPLIIGQVDNVEYDPIKRTLVLTGRDLSAPFIDSRTSEKFQNLTSSQIATQLAQRHGLATTGIQATTTKAGTYYNIDHVMLTQEQTEWDLLIYLAQDEGFDVWVSGNALNFQPSPVTTAAPYKIICPPPSGGKNSSGAMDINLTRAETLAQDVIVKVRSWNQKQQQGFTVQSHRSQAFKSQRSGGKAQTYVFRRPNLSQAQAQQLADSLAEDITRHERVLTARLPGDNTLTTRCMIQLTGTGTAWDQQYYPDTVTRTLSFEGGYHMEVRAKNHSPQSTTLT